MKKQLTSVFVLATLCAVGSGSGYAASREGVRPLALVSKGSGAGNGLTSLTGGVEKGIVSGGREGHGRSGNGAGNGFISNGFDNSIISGGVERGFAGNGVERNFAGGDGTGI